MSFSREDNIHRRFYFLNATVSIVLLVVIVVSILQFGAAAFEGKRTVGIILPGKETDIGWNESNSKGLKGVCQKLGFEPIIAETVGTDMRSLSKAVDYLAQKGAKTVFFANTENLYEAANIASTHPSISFYGMALDDTGNTVRKYSVRYAESYYLAGILAGLKTRTNRLGFIAPHPSPAQHQMINAFAIGAKQVNKDAKVLLAWTGAFSASSLEEQAVRDMKANAVDTLTYFGDGDTIPNAASRARIDYISLYFKHSSIYNLAVINVNWEKIYLNLLRKENSNVNVNYIATLQNDDVDIIVNRNLNSRHQAIFGAEAYEVKNGKNIFTGPIKDNRGVLRVKNDEVIGVKNLDSMSYLVEGVRVLGN
ncbi:MAG: BMP family ABC transporter substrate-binding protein [Selenomonadaceae bacterium]|nr:BMP family ABC transporter substrate-binding protein [Selenomonadaceae bacterium]